MKALNIENYPNEKYELIKTYELENLQMNEKIVDGWNA
jgi:hypothetical protein